MLSFESEVIVNYVTDLIFVQLEDTLQDSFNFVDFEDQVFVEIVHQEDLSQLVKDKPDKVVQWSKSLEGQQPLIPLIKFSVLGEDYILAAKIVLQEEEINLIGNPS